MSFRVPVGSQTITPEEKRAVLSVLDSNQISPGPKVKEFEHEFAKAHGARHGLFVNSGTDALRIALATLKEVHRWEDGDKVLVPAVTFVATVNVILQNGLTPVFVDIGQDYHIERRGLQSRIQGVRAIIPVHLFGKPCQMNGNIYPFSIMDAVRHYETRVIEDSCECMGVSKLAGHIACYSTYVCHLISTGVGGLAVTNSRLYADVMRSYANHGRCISHIPGNRKGPMEDRFRFDRIGYSARATDIQAAIGIEQLKHLKESIKRRRAIAMIFDEALRDCDLRLPLVKEDKHSVMMYPIVIQPWSSVKKWDLCRFLEKNGIETREMLPLINQPCYKSLKIDIKQFPNADLVNRNGFYIGCHPGMTESDVAHVVETFRRFYGKKTGAEKPKQKFKAHVTDRTRLLAA